MNGDRRPFVLDADSGDRRERPFESRSDVVELALTRSERLVVDTIKSRPFDFETVQSDVEHAVTETRPAPQVGHAPTADNTDGNIGPAGDLAEQRTPAAGQTHRVGIAGIARQHAVEADQQQQLFGTVTLDRADNVLDPVDGSVHDWFSGARWQCSTRCSMLLPIYFESKLYTVELRSVFRHSASPSVMTMAISDSTRQFGPSTRLPDVLQFMQLLWAVVHGLERTSKRMILDVGVTGPQRLVLRVVGLYPGVSAGELATILHVHPSTLMVYCSG